MHLKVGDLARRTGLTVRTLHHYDEIGLLKPSVRSDAGYRMYAAQDVARLHAIQALRYLGLALGEIAPILEGRNARPEAIIDQQMQALQRRIREATSCTIAWRCCERASWPARIRISATGWRACR